MTINEDTGDIERGDQAPGEGVFLDEREQLRNAEQSSSMGPGELEDEDEAEILGDSASK